MWSSNRGNSAHEQLKQNHSRYMLGAAFAALVVTGLGAVFSPPYVEAPYELPERPMEPVPPIAPTYVKPEVKPFADPEPVFRSFEIDPLALDNETISDMVIFQLPPIQAAKKCEQYIPILEVNPTLLHFKEAAYPEIARKMEAEGVVEIKILVDKNGQVVQASILKSNVIEALEIAAVTAARECLFVPARQNKTPIKSWVIISYSFTLDR